MYEVIENREDIEKYQELLLNILRYKTKEFEDRKIPYHTCRVYWSPSLHFWSANNPDSDGCLFKNNFGLENPEDVPKNNVLSNMVDINFSFNLSKAGIFLKDIDTGKIFVGHQGAHRIRILEGNVEGREMFNMIFNDKIIEVPGQRPGVVCIGELPTEESQYHDFQERVEDFIIRIKKVKNNIPR